MMFGRKFTEEEKPIWKKFYDLGMTNGWMNGEYDRADGNFICESDRLNMKSGFVIDKVGELKQFFKAGNWCLGCSVMHKDFCFMQQVNGGDEWMVAKYDKETDSVFSFESWSCAHMIKDKNDKENEFSNCLRRIKKATNEQLRRGEY